MNTGAPAGPAPALWRRKPVTVTAVPWHRHGDDPGVRRYLDIHPDARPCAQCPAPLEAHGWIATLEDGHRVCPGDMLVTGTRGERWPVKPYVFRDTYEPAADDADAGEFLADAATLDTDFKEERS